MNAKVTLNDDDDENDSKNAKKQKKTYVQNVNFANVKDGVKDAKVKVNANVNVAAAVAAVAVDDGVETKKNSNQN